MSNSNSTLVRMIARALLTGEPIVEQIVSRAGRVLGRRCRWLGPLARRYVAKFSGHTCPREREVVRFLLQDEGFQDASRKHKFAIAQWVTESERMRPVAAAAKWDLPVIKSVGELANWLGITLGELQWFADLKGLERRKNSPRLRHYHYRTLIKLSGKVRLIEAPKPRLKEMQRKILTEILQKIPPHPAAHGFLKGRSIKTFIAPHVGQRVVLRMDLKDFFPCIIGARIEAFFRTLGYPESVADLLAGLCTNAAPRDVWNTQTPFEVDRVQLREARELYSRIHLPQGTPTSPALANLCAYRVDSRVTGLADSASAVYTRYADDLAFSGGELFERRVERFSTHVAAILFEEGFAVHHRKTRIMRQGVRQHLAGLVANQRVNVMRTDFDRLKAILTNCVRYGPESQNRTAHPQFRSHLEGRLGFVEMVNPAKGKRLRAIFDRIQWP